MALLAPVVLTAYSFPDGSIEGSAVVRVASARGDSRRGAPTPDREDRDYDRENARRAARQQSRFIRHNELTRLLTFTNGSPDGFTSQRETLDTFAGWLKHNRHLLGDTPVAVVAEQGGKGGRWHLHAAIRSGYRLDYNGIRNSWTRYLDRHGWHSAAPSGLHRFNAGDDTGKHSQGFSSARACALYMAKYLTKSIEETERLRGAHRYRLYNGDLPTPLRSRHRSLTAALRSLGRVGRVYPLEYLNAATGELCQYGFLFDSGGG